MLVQLKKIEEIMRNTFQTKNAMENYISGVILFDETIRQKSKKKKKKKRYNSC